MTVTEPKVCTKCGRENKRGGPTCSRCYMGTYRQTEKGKTATRKALKQYEQKNPEKRARWVNTYRERVTLVPLEVHELRHAIKRIERALVAAENGTAVHEPSKRRCDQATQRIARFGDSEGVFGAGTDDRADSDGRSATGTGSEVNS